MAETELNFDPGS